MFLPLLYHIFRDIPTSITTTNAKLNQMMTGRTDSSLGLGVGGGGAEIKYSQ
jgi:hypothetical protein